MYILIDTRQMSLRYKHQNYFTLGDVAFVEGVDSYSLFDIHDARGFREFTDSELAILYRDITTVDHSGLKRPQLIQVLYDLAQRIQESDIDPVEADRQASFVAAEEPRCWRYVRGATRPTPATEDDLFPLPVQKAKRSEEEEANAIAGNLPALQHKAPVATAGAGPVEPAVSTVAPAKGGNGPKRGTAKALIWSVADRMWEENGSPSDKSEVLKIRKSVMAELESKEGIKKSSSSSELGIWHKTRAPF